MATPRIPSEAEARAAMKDVIEALNQWRDEVAASSKRCSEVVHDKIAGAAATLGWPKDVLEANKSSLREASEAQLMLIDQMTDAWEAQLKSPLSSRMPLPAMGGAPFNPMDFWLQAATAWQKTFVDTWSAFSDRERRM